MSDMFPPNDQSPDQASTIDQKIGLLHRLRNYFLTGVVFTAPIAITVFIGWKFIRYLDERTAVLIPAKYNPENYLPFAVPGIGLVIAVLGLMLIGALTANFLGRYLTEIGENIVNRMPVVRSIYNALKQIFETAVSQSSTSFRQVVLVEYPRKGIWAIAFQTANTSGEVFRRLNGREMLNVFLPTTPNPTSGFLLFVPKDDVVFLDMSVEEGIKLVISAGMVIPPDRAVELSEAVPQTEDTEQPST
jgi:uncharacterized membrane protein